MNTKYFILLLSLLIVEMTLLARWNRLYLRYGLPIYFKKIALNNTFNDGASKKINGALKCLPIGYEYREIENNVFALRDSFARFSANSLMRGIIIYDSKNNTVRIYGHLYLSIVAIFAFVLSVLGPAVIPFCIIIFSIPYIRNRIDFNKIADIIKNTRDTHLEQW